jgi:hypothetical protein
VHESGDGGGTALVPLVHDLVMEELTLPVPPSPDHAPATCWIQHTTSCITQSNAPEDGQNCCPKNVELIWFYQ